jgi:hypothetical protein
VGSRPTRSHPHQRPPVLHHPTRTHRPQLGDLAHHSLEQRLHALRVVPVRYDDIAHSHHLRHGQARPASDNDQLAPPPDCSVLPDRSDRTVTTPERFLVPPACKHRCPSQSLPKQQV